jgi:MEMO1 family protein
MGSAEAAGPARGRLTRRPTAAGTFYPADPAELAHAVDELLACAEATAGGERPRAIVVPHAAYPYSGPVAATAYATLRGAPAGRVVLLGPAHFVRVEGIAAPEAETWEIPLGRLVVDDGLRAAAIAAGVGVDDAPHAPEHAIEVQLPFLVRALAGTPSVLPLAVGGMPADEVADVLDAVSPSADLLVVSTDLSHYLDEWSARRVDRRTADAVLARDVDAIADGAACGVRALRGIVAFARRHDLAVRLLDLRTSADTAGGSESVVGYGAFAIG